MLACPAALDPFRSHSFYRGITVPLYCRQLGRGRSNKRPACDGEPSLFSDPGLFLVGDGKKGCSYAAVNSAPWGRPVVAEAGWADPPGTVEQHPPARDAY